MKGITATELPHRVDENASPSSWQGQQTRGERDLHLTNEGNSFFSQSTALASMELEGFDFKATCSLWLLIWGFFFIARGENSQSV